MSLTEFQAQVVRLLVNPGYLAKLRQNPALLDHENGLTEIERRRLLDLVSQYGMDMAVRQCMDRHLDQLEAVLPLTSTLLTSRAFVTQARHFWTVQPPASGNCIMDAIDFCEDLLWRQQFSSSKYLREVASFEKASLMLQLEVPDVEPVQRINFRHDPKALLAPLMRGHMPRRVPINPCQVIGQRDEHGRVSWQVMALREPLADGGTDDFSPQVRSSTLAPLGLE